MNWFDMELLSVLGISIGRVTEVLLLIKFHDRGLSARLPSKVALMQLQWAGEAQISRVGKRKEGIVTRALDLDSHWVILDESLGYLSFRSL